MPQHYPPWNSWHSEVFAFAFMLFLSGALIKRHFLDKRSAVLLPKAGWLAGFLCLVIAIQMANGRITFLGDGLVLIFYLLLCVLALAVGYSIGADKEKGVTSSNNAVMAVFAAAVALGGVLSVMVALAQSLDIWESANWVARMHSARRPGGNIGQPNHLATLILFSIASTIYLFETRRLNVVSAAVVAAFLMLGLAMTESRGGLIALVVVTLWWFAKKRKLGFRMTASGLSAGLMLFVGCLATWPSFLTAFEEGSWVQDGVATVSTSAGTRLIVWPQLWEAVLQKPVLGWGLRETSSAHNAVVHAYDKSEAFVYAHNIVIDLAIGLGLPLTVLIVGAVAIWLWRRARAVNDLHSWYCLAFVLPFGVHAMLEYPFAYAYLLLPATIMVGILEAKLAHNSIAKIPWSFAAASWSLLLAALVWSAWEYIELEDDFRVVRFESMRMGTTPADYDRPNIVLLTQLESLMEAGRIKPSPGMTRERIELARKVALHYPWPATLNRYALSLALNGNPEEGVRQLKVIRTLHGEKSYSQIKANWEDLGKTRFPQLGALKLP